MTISTYNYTNKNVQHYDMQCVAAAADLHVKFQYKILEPEELTIVLFVHGNIT
jgi:hypothetical protein